MLDALVRERHGVSWGKARGWIESGKVFVDGAVVTDPTRRVRLDSVLDLRMEAPRPRSARAAALPAEAIVYVDAHVVVVAKPAGISTVPYDESEEGTLDALVRDRLSRPPFASPSQRGRPSLGVVHRIDKETTGLVVFTRTWLAKQALSAQFRAHTVHRRYLALVHGAADGATYRSHLIEDRGDGLRGSVERRPLRPGQRGPAREGQLAITHVAVEERLAGATLVACRLETGRTHQIRIHLSEAGHPLLGERVYIRRFAGPEIPAPRLMLHAAELGFVHPATEEDVRFTSQLPADIAETRSRLRAIL